MVATPFGFIWAGLVIASGMVANVGLGALFGLSQIVWFVFIGVILLRRKDAQQIVAADV